MPIFGKFTFEITSAVISKPFLSCFGVSNTTGTLQYWMLVWNITQNKAQNFQTRACHTPCTSHNMRLKTFKASLHMPTTCSYQQYKGKKSFIMECVRSIDYFQS